MSPLTFESWYQTAYPRLVRSLTAVCGDADLAADATAEALARLWERWDAGAVVNPDGWTFQVALNLVRRGQRRLALERTILRRERQTPQREPDVHPEVWRALNELPRRQREAIALRYVADLTEADVAHVMGVAVGTASATLTSARRTLATALDHLNLEETHGRH